MDEPKPGQARDESWIVGLLEALNDDLRLAARGPEAGPDSESEARAYVELLGLLSHEPEPAVPDAAVRRGLMAAIAGRGTASAGRGFKHELPNQLPPRHAAARWSRWALPAAAGLTALLLGLSGWQLHRLEVQERTIATLSERLDAATLRSSQLAQVRSQLGTATSKLALITAPGTEVCSLQPVGDRPLQPGSRGVLFVAADHQHWYLRVDGLAESAPRGAYQLWFITSELGAVSGGTFDVGPGTRIELASETMPAGTRAVSITLEPPGGSPSPSGPQILYGEEVMRIL